MAKKTAPAPAVFMDGDDITTIRSTPGQGLWEWGINLQVNNLYTIPPYQSSRPVLEAMAKSGKKAIILPSAPLGSESGLATGAEPVDGIDWGDRRPDWLDATRAGAPPLNPGGEGGPRDRTSLPIFKDYTNPKNLGTGHGSDVVIRFTSQDYLTTLSLPGGRPDEVLLHEMVHAVRMQRGKSLALHMDDDYDTVEEFDAILITNIYRAECGYKTLRAHHAGKVPLAPPFTSDREYYRRYKAQIDTLVGEMRDLCEVIARVGCWFNPLRVAVSGH